VKLCASLGVYSNCRWNSWRVYKFIMIFGGIVCVFNSLYRLTVEFCARLVVYSDCRWNYVRV